MIRIALAAMLALALANSPAPAWNSIGHMTIAKLAYDQLDAKRQIALFQLLKTHPHYEDYLAASRPADLDNDVDWVVLRCAVWPDWIRAKKKDKRGVEIHTYYRGEEHYVNIPFIDPKDEKEFAGKTLIDPDLPSIITALKQRANDIKTKTAAKEDRAIAACWLFHLVGDIHQPLHNVAYFSSDPAFRTGDQGGNKFGIKADGKKWRLHAFWDDLLGYDSDYNDHSVAHQTALYRAAIKNAERLRGLELTDVIKDRLAKNTTFASWSREGFELAKSVAYQNGDGNGLLKAVAIPLNGIIPDDVEDVGAKYIQNAHATAERQAVLAGRRLAERFKLVLEPSN